ncbi:MAG: 50S ribosomal protein L18 [Cytophagales bacterium]|nr:50S ribosomal protein L18 [Cytophagales bacterium]
MAFNKTNRRIKIKQGIRRKINGTADIPRVSVFRSNKAFYAQLIDDLKGHTITAASSQEMGKSVVNIEISKEVGKKFAEKAKAAGVEKVVFDRNGYPYHGKVKAFAEGAREAGLKF